MVIRDQASQDNDARPDQKRHDRQEFDRSAFDQSLFPLLIVFAQPIFDLLYGGQYHADIRLLALLGLLPLSGGIAGVLESALFASGRPKLATMSYATSALMTLTVGWGLLVTNGVMGAGMGLLVASVAAAAAMAWSFIRVTRHEDFAARPIQPRD